MDERNGLFREMQKNDGCFKTNEKKTTKMNDLKQLTNLKKNY